MNLRPDQEAVNAENIYAFSQGKRQVFNQCCTGWGKTYLAKHQIHRAFIKEKLVYYIVPRLMLQQQMADTIDLPHLKNNYQEGVRVCIFTMQTLSKIMQSLPIPDLIYVDEAHHGGNELDEIVMFYKSHNVYSIYLSATPEDSNGRGFIHWTDTLIQGKPMRWLIDNKLLSDYDIYAPDIAMDSRTIYGDIAHHWRTYATGMRTLGFCVDRNHAKQTVAGLQAQGIRCEYIDGTMKRAEQSFKINALADSKIDVLLSVALVTTGFDLEQYVKRKCTIEAMLDLAKTDSLPLQLQKWGRVLRYKESSAVILDFVGNYHTHGLPCEERKWSLEGKKKRKQLEREEFRARQCENCYDWYDAKLFQCPTCQHAPSRKERIIKVLKGELVKINKDQRKVTETAIKKQEGWAGMAKLYMKRGSTRDKAIYAAAMRQARGDTRTAQIYRKQIEMELRE